jgi:predicted nucleic acid-binding protein
MMGVTYDAGALVAADRGERRVWARHGALLALREVPTTPTPVVAKAWRGGSRQALLARFLVGCDIELFDDEQARDVGVLAGRAGTRDIVDACVVEGALRRHDIVVSSDPDDLEAIANSVNRHLEVERP